ncbi:MAG TPA: TetR/AcrR family transcriptional regulator [Rectinemataceae bacterium]|nr:TetR/AcrR family transcriptional regulator [Rectinemataceae bacterium]
MTGMEPVANSDSQKKASLKRATGKKLEKAAISLFARKWYNTVSVAEICREAGLSNGIFYKYYTGKEELFRKLLETVIDNIRAALSDLGGQSVTERISAFVRATMAFSRDMPDQVAVFREGQYRFFEYERKLEELYRNVLTQVLGRDIGEPEYLFALGGIRFCAIRSALQGIDLDEEAVIEILRSGIFGGQSFDPDRVFGGAIRPLAIELDGGARERLIQAGKRLFGEKGFFETNIHEITDAAGLSVGAFYSHFSGKETFYAELIRRAGHDVRTFISSNMGGGLNRLERELRGIWLFLVFLSIDRNCYEIVREAEFVLRDEVRDYYAAFVEGYRANVDGNGEIAARGPRAESAVIEYLLGIAHYSGIDVAFDGSVSNARSVLEAVGKYLQTGFSAYI